MRRKLAVMRHVDTGESLAHSRADLIRRHAEVLGSKGDVIFHDSCDELVVGILEDHADLLADLPELTCIGRRSRVKPVDAAGARRRQQECIEVLRERRFARAIRAEHRDECPLLDRKAHIVECTVLLLRAGLIAVREMFQLNPCHTFTFPFESMVLLYRRLTVNTNAKQS